MIVVVSGLVVGALLGALGAGGSVLTVPILVYGLGKDVANAAVTSLLIVGVTAAAGAVSHARAGSIELRTAVALSIVSAGGSFPGTVLRARIDPAAFMVAFAGLMVAAAVLLWRWRVPKGRDVVAECGADDARPGYARLAAAGLGIGFLTGFFGVGGGFLVFPVLVLVVGVSTRAAVGTSLVVVSAASALAHGFSSRAAGIDWDIAAPFAAAGVLGSHLGRRAGARLPETALRRAFAVVLVVLAGFVVAKAR